MDETMNILNTFAKTSKTTFGKRNNYKAEVREVAFARTRDLSKVTCYHCRKKGHYAKTYPEKEAKNGEIHTEVAESDIEDEEGDELGYIYHQNLPGLNWTTCLLINSKSSVDIFNNTKLLTNIHQAKKP